MIKRGLPQQLPGPASEPVRDLILKLLDIDPKSRISIEKILEHGWVKSRYSARTPQMNKQISQTVPSLPEFDLSGKTSIPVSMISHTDVDLDVDEEEEEEVDIDEDASAWYYHR
mmetsp:Transcript_16990/g.25503  ORF Transcript_16990/g.25503 Transcript_16990/m.25503 type:complete len:114 (+) Transcript_16990:55-396(+)